MLAAQQGAKQREQALRRGDSVRWTLAALDIVLLVLVSFVPWMTLEGELESCMMIGGQIPADWPLPAVGYRILTQLVPSLRVAQGAGQSNGTWWLVAAGVFVVALWVLNVVALGVAMSADISGRQGTLAANVVGLLTCPVTLVLMFVTVRSLAILGGLARDAASVARLTMGAACPGLWVSAAAHAAALVTRSALTRFS